MASDLPIPTTESLKRPLSTDEPLGTQLTPLPTLELSISAPTAPASPSSIDAPNSNAPILPNGVSRQPSPALSTVSTLTSISATPPPSVLLNPDAPGQSVVAPPAKRQKLTFAEKEQRKLEKEARDKERALEKARKEEERALEKAKKDEEKLQKDEERRQKNEEKEEKRREKELEKQHKDEEKRRKEEEIAKKERAQSRMTAFFIKPSTPTKPFNTKPTSSGEDWNNDPNLVNAQENHFDNDRSIAQSVIHKLEKSDYEKAFLPFCLPTNGILAPQNSFSWDDQARFCLEKNISEVLQGTSDLRSMPRLLNSLDLPPQPLDSKQKYTSVTDLMNRMESSSSHPVDLTLENTNLRQPLDELRKVPMKYIYFYYEVRPPYVGTNTKITYQQEARRMMRNPFRQTRSELEYDYDSEAEWEEPDEGEDILSENESETESAAGDEMDDFLDDEDAPEGQRQKKGRITSDLQPISTGVCWENSKGVSNVSTETLSDFKKLKVESLLEAVSWPIDPFCSSYWQSSTKQELLPSINSSASTSIDAIRQPLQTKPNIFVNARPASTAYSSKIPSEQPTKSKLAKPTPGILAGEDLLAFKQAVNGSDLPKVGLLSVLKKRFPKVRNDILKETLGHVAVRVGSREAEKQWKLLEEAANGDAA